MSRADRVREEIYRSYKIVVEHDPDAQDPRVEWDNVTKMWCAHRRYNLGDYKEFPNEAVTEEEVRAMVEQQGDKVFLLKKLYMYDHSGITVRTRPFACNFDSGQIGWVWITDKVAKTEGPHKKRTKKLEEWAERVLEAEVETYDQYLTGSVFGYRVLAISHDDDGEEIEGDEIDSLWGMFGDLNYVLGEARESIDAEHRHRLAERIARLKVMIRNRVPLFTRQQELGGFAFA